MSINFLVLGGYGYFVWPAFIFAFLNFYILYAKTLNKLKKQEQLYINEFNQAHPINIKTVNLKKNLSKSLIF